MPYASILVPTDLSAHSQQTLQVAFAEAEAHRARLILLHVLQHHPDTEEYYIRGDPEGRADIRDSLVAFPVGFDPDTGSKLPTPPPPQPAVVRRDYLEEARQQLHGLVPPSFTGLWEIEVATGDPVEAIVRIAQQQDTDLIVMGSHGHTGLRHLLLGSVAESVLRHAPCPVLIVRHHETV